MTNHDPTQNSHLESQIPPEEMEIEDDLTTENLAAQAIWEQIQLDRQKNGSSPHANSTRAQRIDPSFQSDFDNI